MESKSNEAKANQNHAIRQQLPGLLFVHQVREIGGRVEWTAVQFANNQ